MIQKRRVIVVEDREKSRKQLKYLLSTFHPDMEVIGDFEDIQSAWAMIESGGIEGIFLDISFDLTGGSEKDGLVLAQRIVLLNTAPWIIFITGKEEYAIEVINTIRPFGYLLKPFDEKELKKILDRLRDEIPPRPILIEIRHKVVRIAEDGHVERLTFTRFLQPDEILYVYSNTETSSPEVHLVNGDILKDVNINLNGWLAYKLPCFIKIRRNIIVNLKYVCGYRIDPKKEGNYLAQFKVHSIELPVSSNYFDEFKNALKNCLS